MGDPKLIAYPNAGTIKRKPRELAASLFSGLSFCIEIVLASSN